MRPLSSAARPQRTIHRCVCLFNIQKTRKINSICESSATDIHALAGIFGIQHSQCNWHVLPLHIRPCIANVLHINTEPEIMDRVSDFSFIIILVIMLANLLICGYWFSHKCSAHTRHTHESSSSSFDIGHKNRRLFCVVSIRIYGNGVLLFENTGKTFASARQPDE